MADDKTRPGHMDRGDFLKVFGGSLAVLTIGALAPQTAIAAPAGPLVGARVESPVEQTTDVMFSGFDDRVDSGKLKIAGVIPGETSTFEFLGFKAFWAEPGVRTIDYISLDPAQAKIDEENIKSGAAVLTGLAIRHLTQEKHPVPLGMEGMTRFALGYGVLTIINPHNKQAGRQILLPSVEDRGYLVLMRGYRGGPNDRNNTTVWVTDHDPAWADAFILPDRGQFDSENQLKQLIDRGLGNQANNKSCTDSFGCKEIMVVGADAEFGAFAVAKITGKDGAGKYILQDPKTNIV